MGEALVGNFADYLEHNELDVLVHCLILDKPDELFPPHELEDLVELNL